MGLERAPILAAGKTIISSVLTGIDADEMGKIVRERRWFGSRGKTREANGRSIWTGG